MVNEWRLFSHKEIAKIPIVLTIWEQIINLNFVRKTLVSKRYMSLLQRTIGSPWHGLRNILRQHSIISLILISSIRKSKLRFIYILLITIQFLLLQVTVSPLFLLSPTPFWISQSLPSEPVNNTMLSCVAKIAYAYNKSTFLFHSWSYRCIT